MKRGKPLKRTGFKGRRKPMRQRRAKPRRGGGVKDEPFKAFVRSLPCAGIHTQQYPCDGGPRDPDHADDRGRGLGQKADDKTCIPMTRRCHTWREDFGGPYRMLDKESMREWCLDRIRETQMAWVIYRLKQLIREAELVVESGAEIPF